MIDYSMVILGFLTSLKRGNKKGEATPGPSKREGNKEKEDELNRSSSFLLTLLTFDVLFPNHEHKAAAGLTGNGFGEGSAVADVPAGGLLTVEEGGGERLPLDDSLEREGNLLLLVGAVDAGYIPSVATTAGQYHIVGGIAANKAGLIPNSGQLTEEFLHLVGLREIALGLVGQMLQG